MLAVDPIADADADVDHLIVARQGLANGRREGLTSDRRHAIFRSLIFHEANIELPLLIDCDLVNAITTPGEAKVQSRPFRHWQCVAKPSNYCQFTGGNLVNPGSEVAQDQEEQKKKQQAFQEAVSAAAAKSEKKRH